MLRKIEVNEFLKEYNLLIKKYGMTINSCSCCDSPWIMPLSVDGKTIWKIAYREKDEDVLRFHITC